MAVILVATMHTSISGAVPYFGSYFGTRSSPPFITSVNCYRTPSRILDCSYSAITLSCNQASDAGVVCIGKTLTILYHLYVTKKKTGKKITVKVLKMHNYVHNICMVYMAG